MELPDNLLAELEILENITSCNKVVKQISHLNAFVLYFENYILMLYKGGELPDAQRVRAESDQGD